MGAGHLSACLSPYIRFLRGAGVSRLVLYVYELSEIYPSARVYHQFWPFSDLAGVIDTGSEGGPTKSLPSCLKLPTSN